MALHLFLYFGSQYWEGEPHTVGCRLDERIPVVPGFIYIYCSWFLMLVLVPLVLYRADTGNGPASPAGGCFGSAHFLCGLYALPYHL